MSRPTAKEDICNLSCDYLKQPPIQSISTPVTQTEFIFARWYDIKRQAALRAHPWKFASTRTTLTPTTVTPPFGYTYAYNLPNDYIRKISIGNDVAGDLKRDHAIENGQLLTSSGSGSTDPETLFLRYVYDCQEVAKFDALFCLYFALGMALDLSPKFSVSARLKQELKVQFMDYELEAKAVNGQDAPIKRIQQSRILMRRRGMPGGIWASNQTVFPD